MSGPKWTLTYSLHDINWPEVRRFLTRAGTSRWERVVGGIAGGLIGLAFVIWIGELFNTDPGLVAVKAIPIVALSLGLAALGYLLSANRRKRVLAEDEDRIGAGLIALTVDETGVALVAENAGYRHAWAWARIHDVIPWSGGALIRFKPWEGLPIPATAFASPAEVPLFVADASRTLSAEKGPQS